MGVAFYVFALFPGVAFVFAREGHQPSAKRSAIRETASIVFVSVICDAVLALALVLAGALWKPLQQELLHILAGDYSWGQQNPAIAVVAVFVAIALTTLLGSFLGSEWAHDHGLWRIWQSSIPRDTSVWVANFGSDLAKGNEVRLGVQLKSGRWITGSLFAYDNDPEPGPHRALTLTNVFTRTSASSKLLPLADLLIVEAGEVEFLQVTYLAPADPDGAPETG
jgi:hypothetical protein